MKSIRKEENAAEVEDALQKALERVGAGGAVRGRKAIEKEISK